MVSVCFRLLQIMNIKIFQIGVFFRLASDWFQNGFRLARRISDCVFRFQIASDCFRFISDWQCKKKQFRLDWQSEKKSLKLQILSSNFRLHQINGNWQFASVIDEIASAEEENDVAAAAAEERDEL